LTDFHRQQCISFFPYETQVDIVVACCIIHNWVIEDGSDEFNVPNDNDEDTQHTIYSLRFGK
jgi:hypothetical protein